MVRAFFSGALGLIPSRVKPMTLELFFTASLLDARHRSAEWRTNRQVFLKLWCRWEKHLAGLPHFRVVDRWPETPKRARYSALIASS